jgi:D-arabinitol dehydrogenase (NADP+)
VCGTDVHLHRGEFIGVFPLTPGHEITGVVDAVGDGVEGLAAGELIALDNMMSCGDCRPCRRARPQFCDTLRALGVTEPGGFAEHVLAPAGKCHRVSDLDPDVAVFAEPVACACTDWTCCSCGRAATCCSSALARPGSSWPSCCERQAPAA